MTSDVGDIVRLLKARHRGRPVYILGEVNKPGSYPYRAGMNILNAAALAGGFTYRADEDDIKVSRRGIGQPKIMAPAASPFWRRRI